MTTTNEQEENRIIADGLAAVEQYREAIKRIEAARASQPERLAKARSDAEEARGWAVIEEPWKTLVSAIPTYNADGKRTGDSLTLPSITAKEMFGARLCFDMLDCGDDCDRLEDVKTRYFSMLNGDTGNLFLVCMAALDTIASLVVPQMVDDLETHASNYDVRVMLAEARAKAWNGRVSEICEINSELGELGVKPVDGHDIGASALDPDVEGPHD